MIRSNNDDGDDDGAVITKRRQYIGTINVIKISRSTERLPPVSRFSTLRENSEFE